ncbi:Uncharacterised protein [Segatella copri]|nr:Uncharacterised protein [Segatella copri]
MAVPLIITLTNSRQCYLYSTSFIVIKQNQNIILILGIHISKLCYQLFSCCDTNCSIVSPICSSCW